VFHEQFTTARSVHTQHHLKASRSMVDYRPICATDLSSQLLHKTLVLFGISRLTWLFSALKATTTKFIPCKFLYFLYSVDIWKSPSSSSRR
jgi:hypothetical protein